jgi:hypothetical protein
MGVGAVLVAGFAARAPGVGLRRPGACRPGANAGEFGGQRLDLRLLPLNEGQQFVIDGPGITHPP